MSLDQTPFVAVTRDQLPVLGLRVEAGVEIRMQGRVVETLPVEQLDQTSVALKAPNAGLTAALAAFEALSNHNAEEMLIKLRRAEWAALEPDLLSRGAALVLDTDWLGVFPSMLWQLPDLWLSQSTESFPAVQVPGPHGAHPLRPPKPEGVLYRRYVPWIDQVFSLRAVQIDTDLDTFHHWMNDERVAAFFEESGTLEYHRDYLNTLQADPHMMPVFGCLEGRPFAYFELYWARENRIGAHYPAGAWDRGWHVLVGEEDVRGVDYITTWLPSLMHYMFLAEPRTTDLMGEPRADHQQQIRNLQRSGFAKVKEFDFPHKRATMVRLERDYFFQARLWARPDPADPGRPLSRSVATALSSGDK